MLKNILDERRDLQGSLFQKGFLITNSIVDNLDSYPFYGNWDQVVFGEYNFFIYKTTNRFFVQDHDKIFFLIGHAFNPFSMEIKEENILKRISSAYGTCEFYELISELTGVFILGVVDKTNIEILLDASGMQYGCYGCVNGYLYISSHMRLIGDICDLHDDPYVSRLVNYKWYKYMMGNYIAGDGTCYEEIKRVIPNTVVLYKNNNLEVKRFYPTKQIDMCQTDDEYKRVIEEAAIILKNTMKLISEKWNRPVISLTGGIDSNTTFAAANGVYDKFSTFSYVSMYRESVDAQKAKEIADKFNVNHITYQIPEKNDDIVDFELYKMIQNYNGGAIGKTKDEDVRKRVTLSCSNIGDVEVKSWVSETIRAYAYKYFGRSRNLHKLTSRNYTSLYKIFLLDRKLVSKTDKLFEEYIQKTKLKENLYNYDESDFFVWEMMHGGKCGLNIGVMKCYSEITIPYNNRMLLDLLLRVPLKKRISDQHHLDLKKYLNEELYKMNIRVVNLNQPRVRGKLLNIYYTINSFLPF